MLNRIRKPSTAAYVVYTSPSLVTVSYVHQTGPTMMEGISLTQILIKTQSITPSLPIWWYHLNRLAVNVIVIVMANCLQNCMSLRQYPCADQNRWRLTNVIPVTRRLSCHKPYYISVLSACKLIAIKVYYIKNKFQSSTYGGLSIASQTEKNSSNKWIIQKKKQWVGYTVRQCIIQ